MGAGILPGLPCVSAKEASLAPRAIQFGAEIEPLVRLLENTSRAKLLEEVAQRIRKGTTYREVLTALLLAGVRNIQPRPVGFKFHAVLVVNSAHLASLNSPDADRWLPLFWALDYFKGSQARDVEEGDWTMAPVVEGKVPAADKARQEFEAAMDAWDEERTDRAITGLVRSAGAQDVFDVMCRYGARDFRDIGHKAIYVSNSWRTLQTIGWHHAEPVLRSLAYALLQHRGGNPSQGNAEADLPGRHNLEALGKIRKDWQGGLLQPKASAELLVVLREGEWKDASHLVVALLNKGVSAKSLWDACFNHAAEMLMRMPGIITLHASTTTNALHFAHQHTFRDETRRFLLLQAVSFLTLFRKRAAATKGFLIDQFDPEDGDPGLEEVFAAVGHDRPAAARLALAHLEKGGDPQTFIDSAQRLIYLKGVDSHDYKFSSAVLEDCRHLSPSYRNRYLAASTAWLQGTRREDSSIVARTREALG
jgi:hypothetical protein